MTIIGSNCQSRTYFGPTSGQTSIINYAKADSNGTINSWCAYVSAAINAKIKIFRDDGTNFIFIGESALLSLSAGLNTNLYCNITVQSGDLIGLYMDGSIGDSRLKVSYDFPSPDKGYYFYNADVTTDIIKTSWGYTLTDRGVIPSLRATSDIENYYVKTGGNDSNSGDSWTNAWATIDKAAKTVADGKTVHIGFGTYNAEPANNDIAPVNAGAVGIKYLPETATTGGGTGSVIVEVN